MTQISFAGHTYTLRDFLKLRWLMILVSLGAQIVILWMVFANLGSATSTTDITLTPVAGTPGVCQVIAIRPFSDAWTPGIQPGMQVRITSGQADEPCKLTTGSVKLQIVGLPTSHFEVDVQSPPVDFFDVALAVFLAIVFNVTGIAILLRAQNRQTARVTYALFTCTALILCLLNLRGNDYYWLNLLGFTTAILVRGLSVTFVQFFSAQRRRRRTLLNPYLPLLIGIALAIFSAFLPLLPLSAELVFIVLGVVYNALCVIIIISVMIWGLRHLSRQERQFVRMVVIGLLFLLIPLVLNFNIIPVHNAVQRSLLRLIPIPLAVLPIACDYALFRQHLLGMASMLSRKAMRGLLWLLLASAFLFPNIILLQVLSNLSLPGDAREYIYAGTLFISLLLFPLLWSKVRDAGDQVFYQDFYEYNRSLRDLSAALTRLQGIEQISAFVLPHLATLLNATEVDLLLRVTPQTNSQRHADKRQRPLSVLDWLMYRHISTRQSEVISVPKGGLPAEHLARIANLGLSHLKQEATEPLLLDGVLLLALYDGDRCSGFLCLGPKINQEVYSKEDRSFLSTLASQLSVLEVNSRYLEQAQADARQMTALTHRVISAQEEERRHLALELHDEALQQAMLVVRQLSEASDMAEVAEGMPLARSVVASLRRTCLELRPPLLDELGVIEAFRWLVRQSEERCGNQTVMQMTCLGDWSVRPDPEVELALYRVAQEGLSNIFKYAGASRVFIRLRRTSDGRITLLIADNGRGMRNKRPLAENLGLAGMHERMVVIGGTWRIRTSPGRGVVIRATCGSHAAEVYIDAPGVLRQTEKQGIADSHVWEGVRA